MKAFQYLQVLCLVAGLVYLAVFHVANASQVVGFPFGLVGAPSLALLGGFLAGLFYASLLYLPPLIRSLSATRRQARRLRELEAEAAKLREPVGLPVIPDRPGPLGLELAQPAPTDGRASG